MLDLGSIGSKYRFQDFFRPDYKVVNFFFSWFSTLGMIAEVSKISQMLNVSPLRDCQSVRHHIN